jgi:glycerophosphoryl diester phosphodiesterase
MTIQIYSHRGARGLAPENTLLSCELALQIGVDFIDFDICFTKDEVAVATHDLALNPVLTRDEHGHWLNGDDAQWLSGSEILVKNLMLSELQQYDVGRISPKSPYINYFPSQQAADHVVIPTLQAIIDLIKSHSTKTNLQIEIKSNPNLAKRSYPPSKVARIIAKILLKNKMLERTEIQAFDYRYLLALQKINPYFKTTYLTSEELTLQMLNDNPKIAGKWTAKHLLKNYNCSVPKMIVELGGKTWGPQDVELTTKLVAEAHDYGLKVVPWAWPEKTGKEFDMAMIKKLIAMKVDGIITDRPDLLKKMIGKPDHLLRRVD